MIHRPFSNARRHFQFDRLKRSLVNSTEEIGYLKVDFARAGVLQVLFSGFIILKTMSSKYYTTS